MHGLMEGREEASKLAKGEKKICLSRKEKSRLLCRKKGGMAADFLGKGEKRFPTTTYWGEGGSLRSNVGKGGIIHEK